MKSIFLVLFTLATLLTADSDRYEAREYHLPKDLRYLDLSREQDSALKAVMQRYRDAKVKLRRSQRETTEQVKALFRQEGFDQERYLELSMAQEKAEIELEAKLLDEIHALLDPDQREHFLYYLDDWIER